MEISATFLGRDLFLYGQAVAGTSCVLAVMEGPPIGSVRLLEKGRVALFWLGVRQYRLERGAGGLPGQRELPVMQRPRGVPPRGCARRRAIGCCCPTGSSSVLTGSPPGPASRASRGLSAEGRRSASCRASGRCRRRAQLYGLRTNAIRLNDQGAFYHTFTLPACAPDGRYRVTTYFLGDDRLLGVESNDVFVRKTGMVESLSRMAARRPAVYGALTVLIAVAAGWLAGTLFKRGGH